MNQFTQKTIEAIQRAQQIAVEYGHQQVDQEHVMLALTEDGAVYGIAYVIESYGIITNKALLAKAGYSVEDINSFETLKKVAEDITARSAELGFAAFSSAGFNAYQRGALH